ncbi:membrane-bound lytic murein transglycosylase MltF [Thiosocius teredinicola]|uniref:membrane-bound lytic murein transglycosylase MltF n=1 Tax=Thiosocius teredinicola TaxID=1973002 RepID=UPI000990E112
MQRTAREARFAAIVMAATLLFCGVAALFLMYRHGSSTELERVQQRGELVVATRHAPTVYHQGAEGPDGFEVALIRAFAKHLGVKPKFVFPETLDDLLGATSSGKVNMAAAGLTATAQRRERVSFSFPYEYVTEQVVYRRGTKRPKSLDEIAEGELHVVADSSHEETLNRLKSNDRPNLTWQRYVGIGTETLLSQLDEGKLRLTVVDSNEVELSRRVYKHAATAFELGDPQPIAWAFPRRGDGTLLSAANDFLRQAQKTGHLQRLQARYFGHSGRMNFVDTRDFWRHVRDRLPDYQHLFEEAADITGIDWRLLAAIGYQESHWQADAVSPTGVRGIMMLTQGTARQVGVTDRNDPQQSIIGGAKYLKVVGRKIPTRIKEPHHLWLTLAGYNVGFGHLEDARILTERDGGNPDLWLEVKQRLPLLTKKEYYSTVKNGFARGNEPVNYVDNIRNYYDLLVWYTTTTDVATRDRLLAAEEEQKPDL